MPATRPVLEWDGDGVGLGLEAALVPVVLAEVVFDDRLEVELLVTDDPGVREDVLLDVALVDGVVDDFGGGEPVLEPLAVGFDEEALETDVICVPPTNVSITGLPLSRGVMATVVAGRLGSNVTVATP